MSLPDASIIDEMIEADSPDLNPLLEEYKKELKRKKILPDYDEPKEGEKGENETESLKYLSYPVHQIVNSELSKQSY